MTDLMKLPYSEIPSKIVLKVSSEKLQDSMINECTWNPGTEAVSIKKLLIDSAYVWVMTLSLI